MQTSVGPGGGGGGAVTQEVSGQLWEKKLLVIEIHHLNSGERTFLEGLGGRGEWESVVSFFSSSSSSSSSSTAGGFQKHVCTLAELQKDEHQFFQKEGGRGGGEGT